MSETGFSYRCGYNECHNKFRGFKIWSCASNLIWSWFMENKLFHPVNTDFHLSLSPQINYSSFQIIISLKTFIEKHISLPIPRSCFIEEDKHLITSPIWFKVCHTLKTLDLITSQSKVENVVAPASLILLFSQGRF